MNQRTLIRTYRRNTLIYTLVILISPFLLLKLGFIEWLDIAFDLILGLSIALWLLCFDFIVGYHILCPHCNNAVSTESKWMCPRCNHKNSFFSFLLWCGNPFCRFTASGFICPHCNEPFFLTEEHNTSSCVKPVSKHQLSSYNNQEKDGAESDNSFCTTKSHEFGKDV